jgi:hypothetical protein
MATASADPAPAVQGIITFLYSALVVDLWDAVCAPLWNKGVLPLGAAAVSAGCAATRAVTYLLFDWRLWPLTWLAYAWLFHVIWRSKPEPQGASK